MTQTAPATPCLAKVPLDADRQAYALLIVHADRSIAPQPALRQVVEFESTPHGGFISAAQAHDGGWGYINEQGQWRVPPTLDNARGFTEDGVARFCRAGRWGYLNLLGQEVIAPQFDDARPMRNGLAAVKTGPHAWRIIDLQGQFTCAATFADLGNFGAVGLAPAQPWDPDRDLPLWGYVDHRGQWVVAPRFAQAHSFDEQAVAAVSANGKTWGLINAQGQWVLQPCRARMDAFNSEALAYYADAATDDGPCGYLNTRGKVAVRGGQGLSHQMACGLVADRAHETCFWDLHGAPLPGPALSYATDFQPELECAVARLAIATSPDANPWGLLHTDGRLVPAPQGLREPLTESDGSIPPTQPDTALVPFLASDGQVVWIDREGQVVWRARYAGGQVIFATRKIRFCGAARSLPATARRARFSSPTRQTGWNTWKTWTTSSLQPRPWHTKPKAACTHGPRRRSHTQRSPWPSDAWCTPTWARRSAGPTRSWKQACTKHWPTPGRHWCSTCRRNGAWQTRTLNTQRPRRAWARPWPHGSGLCKRPWPPAPPAASG